MYICVYVYNKRVEWEQYLRTNCIFFFVRFPKEHPIAMTI